MCLAINLGCLRTEYMWKEKENEREENGREEYFMYQRINHDSNNNKFEYKQTLGI